ncbi:MAG: radical SAM protein [Deltaproteobacteria bacterium]|nr:radical SAM protein [Deltaproteobacteria bacterium]
MPRLARTLVRAQSLGVRVPAGAPGRRGGAGPSEGVTLLVSGRALCVPAFSGYVAQSPLSLEDLEGETWLCDAGKPVARAEVSCGGRFETRTTGTGERLSRHALLHGTDCLATTVFQTCVHWPRGSQCAFCGIRASLDAGTAVEQKSPPVLARAAALARDLDGATHAVLTTGGFGRDVRKLAILCACVEAVAGEGLAVHVQVEPPEDPGVLEMLASSGARTIGLHLESPDPDVLSRVAPAKAAMGKEAFLRAWRRAVDRFGENQVSTFYLAGLGETPDALLDGVRMAADLGVFPLVVPFRPVPGNQMAHSRPPSPEVLEDLYPKAGEILSRAGLHSQRSLAGCVRCGACSGYGWYEP